MAPEALVEEDARGIGVEKIPPGPGERSPATEGPQGEILRGFFLHATQGGFLGIEERHFLIPIEAVRTVAEGFVVIERTKEQVRGGPELDPNIRLHSELRTKIYEYYGYPAPG
jgi:hypothetical protein